VAFKGVLLEGLEVVFIVITFGLTAGDVTPALFGAIGAAVAVLAIAIVIQQPLSRVPENTLKFGVGVMLTAFGTFWAGEGVGLQWPGEDLAILGLMVFYTVAAGLVILFWRSRSESGGPAPRPA
jgi:Ca2+/H+ antiporter, TMEM165/GDT1 family